jgi:hypothetical protein
MLEFKHCIEQVGFEVHRTKINRNNEEGLMIWTEVLEKLLEDTSTKGATRDKNRL